MSQVCRVQYRGGLRYVWKGSFLSGFVCCIGVRCPGIVFVSTFCNVVRWAKVGGEMEFCPVVCDKNVDVGNVSLKNLEFCPTDVLFGILADADYT